MKHLLLVSALVIGTFASAGLASADDSVTAGNYVGWQHDAMISGDR